MPRSGEVRAKGSIPAIVGHRDNRFCPAQPRRLHPCPREQRRDPRERAAQQRGGQPDPQPAGGERGSRPERQRERCSCHGIRRNRQRQQQPDERLLDRRIDEARGPAGPRRPPASKQSGRRFRGAVGLVGERPDERHVALATGVIERHCGEVDPRRARRQRRPQQRRRQIPVAQSGGGRADQFRRVERDPRRGRRGVDALGPPARGPGRDRRGGCRNDGADDAFVEDDTGVEHQDVTRPPDQQRQRRCIGDAVRSRAADDADPACTRLPDQSNLPVEDRHPADG